MSADQQHAVSGGGELTHIGLMQLFYELKQVYPAVPDVIVNSCLRQVILI